MHVVTILHACVTSFNFFMYPCVRRAVYCKRKRRGLSLAASALRASGALRHKEWSENKAHSTCEN